jgi:hypothetical protein
MKRVKVIWQAIDVNHLVEPFAAHAHPCNAIDGARLNANRRVLKGFQQGLDAGEPAVKELRQNQQKQSRHAGEWPFVPSLDEVSAGECIGAVCLSREHASPSNEPGSWYAS